MEDSSVVAVGTAAGLVAGVVAVIVILGIVMEVLLVIAHWKIFTKAGEKGWKSLIPIYHTYVMFRLMWDTKNFWITFALSVAASIFNQLGSAKYAMTESGQFVTTSEGNVIFAFLALIAGIAALVWFVRFNIATAKAFGKGAGYAVGLTLLPNIFLLILGLGNLQYLGPQDA